jgi:hypothetical protein
MKQDQASQLVMAGLVPAISLREATLCHLIEIAGTSPAMTTESKLRRTAVDRFSPVGYV